MLYLKLLLASAIAACSLANQQTESNLGAQFSNVDIRMFMNTTDPIWTIWASQKGPRCQYDEVLYNVNREVYFTRFKDGSPNAGVNYKGLFIDKNCTQGPNTMALIKAGTISADVTSIEQMVFENRKHTCGVFLTFNADMSSRSKHSTCEMRVISSAVDEALSSDCTNSFRKICRLTHATLVFEDACTDKTKSRNVRSLQITVKDNIDTLIGDNDEGSN